MTKEEVTFVLNQEVPFEEGLECEFKSITGVINPVPLIREIIDVYVVAYLNRGVSGSLYFGIRDNRQAVGVSLDARQRDEVRQGIDTQLSSISPPILSSSYEIIFHGLFSGVGAKAPISDQPIIEVKVERVSSPQVFFTAKKEVFIKTYSGREELKGDRLLQLQREKETKQADQEEVEVTPPTSEEPAVKKSKTPAPPKPLDNPYNPAVIATENMFKGREPEIGNLQSAIKNGIHTAIFGLQRMGKTSLVKETLRRSKERCIFAEVDLQSYGGEDITYRTLLHAIITRIAAEISPQRVQFVSDEINIYRNYDTVDKHIMLDEFKRSLKETLRYTRRKVVLFLDEFSELCQTIDKNADRFRNNPNPHARISPAEMLVDVSIMRWFSSLMRDPELKGKVVFIFAVRPFVAGYDANMQLQILKLVTPITLHYLRRSAAEALMVEPVRGKVEYEAGSIDYLYSLTAGHAYLIQFFLHEIINRIQQDGRSCIEKQDITRFEEEIVSVEEVYEGQFAVLESDYSVESVRSPEAARKGRGVIAVIARLGEREEDGWVSVEKVRTLLTNHHMPEDEIYDILAKLRRAQIIKERRADEEKLEYRISIPLLRKRYIRQNMYQRHFQR